MFACSVKRKKSPLKTPHSPAQDSHQADVQLHNHEPCITLRHLSASSDCSGAALNGRFQNRIYTCTTPIPEQHSRKIKPKAIVGNGVLSAIPRVLKSIMK